MRFIYKETKNMSNVVPMSGRVTKEIEVREVNGMKITDFVLAVPRNGKKDEVDFIPCTAFRGTAEYLGKYINKGQMIEVVGSWRAEPYTDGEGKRKTSHKLIVNSVGPMNVVVISGRLTNDVEVREVNDMKVVDFTLAVPRAGKKDEADFIPCTAFRHTAEFIGKYFTKGQMMEVVGSWRADTYTDGEGKRKTSHKTIANNVYFVGDKKKDEEPKAADPVVEDDDDPIPFT